MVHMGFSHSKLCRVPLNCVAFHQILSCATIIVSHVNQQYKASIIMHVRISVRVHNQRMYVCLFIQTQEEFGKNYSM